MSMRLQMLQKPPVVFTRLSPSWVISPTELAMARNNSSDRDEAISWLWVSYSRSILAEANPCMEANEGVSATISLTARYKSLDAMNISMIHEDCYELTLGKASLFLCETEEGEVFLYYFSPRKYGHHRDTYRIDLTDFGSDSSAYFIATVFEAYELIVDYYEKESLSTHKHS